MQEEPSFSSNLLSKLYAPNKNIAIVSIDEKKMDLIEREKSKLEKSKMDYFHVETTWKRTTNPDDGKIRKQAFVMFGISLQQALELGKELEQNSIIYKDGQAYCEVATKDFVCTKDGKQYSRGTTISRYDIFSNPPLDIKLVVEILSKKKGQQTIDSSDCILDDIAKIDSCKHIPEIVKFNPLRFVKNFFAKKS